MFYGPAIAMLCATAAIQRREAQEQAAQAERDRQAVEELERLMRQAGAIDTEARWIEDPRELPPPET